MPCRPIHNGEATESRRSAMPSAYPAFVAARMAVIPLQAIFCGFGKNASHLGVTQEWPIALAALRVVPSVLLGLLSAGSADVRNRHSPRPRSFPHVLTTASIGVPLLFSCRHVARLLRGPGRDRTRSCRTVLATGTVPTLVRGYFGRLVRAAVKGPTRQAILRGSGQSSASTLPVMSRERVARLPRDMLLPGFRTAMGTLDQ